MPEITEGFARALIAAVLPTAAPSAVEDLANRFLRDQPRDLPNYIAVLQSQLPHAFAAPAVVEPAAPTPDQPGYNAYALANLETLAGQPPAGAASTSTAAPGTVARDDPAAFLRHVEAIAQGQTQVG
jgi:hypothetical protein